MRFFSLAKLEHYQRETDGTISNVTAVQVLGEWFTRLKQLMYICVSPRAHAATYLPN